MKKAKDGARIACIGLGVLCAVYLLSAAIYTGPPVMTGPNGVVIMVCAALSAPALERAVRKISFEDINDTKSAERRMKILFGLGISPDGLTFSQIVDLFGDGSSSIAQDLGRLKDKELIVAETMLVENLERKTTTRKTTYNITKKGREKIAQCLEKMAECWNLWGNLDRGL